ncbi:arginine/serine-rich coiled-coil protein 2 [Sabethes cyaneus]|uniref:arginine/serine-rich coiled-coil protein 2 n=1 Tax=Sabethes cyaneus TaxID=53552 RepID=UPI00237E66F0|nr:arginine/serine-rich coiled-coil protein 2 [Sabethes cyaneus]XP_053698285.1 arginine/serine-rich coiled-coil protein 2 [Sabethes cyaneus]
MSAPVGYGTLLECPYNKAHRVQATAMARHLFKCRKMYPDTKFVICPFNHAHRIAEPELKMHTATCEDRANFDMYKYCITTAAATHGTTEAQEPELIYNNEDPIAPKKVHDDDDECWDDLRIPAYNPQEYCANAKIIRKATLKTPAEKRKFYEEETQRHRQLDTKIKREKGEDDDSSSSRSRSPIRRRSPVRSRRRSRSRSRSPAVSSFRRYRKRSRSRSRSNSPLSVRSRRTRSNSRKSRSPSSLRDRKRKRSRSRSVERPAPRRRSPTPEYSRRDRERLASDRYERERSSRPYDYYDYPASSSSRYDSYARYSSYDRYSARSSGHRERYSSNDHDDEYIYRRDFRD